MDELQDQSRWPDACVSRAQAKLIAERHLEQRSTEVAMAGEPRSSRISEVEPIEDVHVIAYGADTRDCWVAYVRRSDRILALRSSEVVLISRQTGEVVYAGSACDEG